MRDLESTNGTSVDGTRIREAMVQPGSVLKVGEVEIAVPPRRSEVEVLPSDKTSFGAAHRRRASRCARIFGVLERIAPTDATVLLEGETGTGKDVLARAIWIGEPARRASRSSSSTAARSRYSLIESELFGHERGAFTGAVASRQGAFELADGGTVFLDEIGELPLDVQPKLLRVLETREFRRVGGNKTMQHERARHRRDEARSASARSPAGNSAKTSTSASPSCPSPCRRCARAARTSRSSSSTCSKAAAPAASHHRLGRDDAGARWRTTGPATCASSATSSSAPSTWRRRPGSRELGVVTLPTGRAATPTRAFHFEPEKSYRETRAKYDAEFERRYVKWLLGRHAGNISAAAREAKMDRKHLHDMAKKHGLRGDEG